MLLIQRSLEGTDTHQSDSQALHGWTLIVPAGWSMPFFSSLIYTGTRVGGLRERKTQSFEAGLAYFPQDYPTTEAYAAHAATRAAEEKARWERKPPAKRPNFEKLGTRSPWKPDWEVVLGLQGATGEHVEGEDLVTTQREGPPPGADKAQPWLLRGSEVTTILASSFDLFNPGAGVWSGINKLRVKRGHDPLNGGAKVEELWRGALVMVKLLMCGRGAPDDLAIVYRVEDDEAREWGRIMECKNRSAAGVQAMGEEAADGMEVRFERLTSWRDTDFLH